MRTIGKRISDKVPGDFHLMCDYCGVMWPRSKLRQDAARMWVCPDEGPGRDVVTLSRQQAMDAGSMPIIRGRVKR